MSHVYISYARADSEFVDKLSDDLEAAGIETWVDRKRLPPGKSWQQGIEDGFSQSRAVITIISKNSALGWFKIDSQQAGNYKIPLIAFFIDAGIVSDVPFDVAVDALVYLDNNYEDALNALIQVLSPTKPFLQSPGRINRVKSKGYVFISYSALDLEFVSHLEQYLDQRGYGFWDFQVNDRLYDTFLFLELEERIGQSTAMLCVLSPSWKTSKWTIQEYLYAKDIGIPTFLLMSKKMEPTLVLEGIKYIDFISNLEEGFKELGRELDKKQL